MHEPTDFHKPFLISLVIIFVIAISFGVMQVGNPSGENSAGVFKSLRTKTDTTSSSLSTLSTTKDSTTTTSTSDLKTNPPPPGTQSATGEKVFLMGGTDSSSTLVNDVWSTIDGDHWSIVTQSAGWSGRSVFGAVYFNNKLWVLGGCSSSPYFRNDVWSSPDGINWTQVTANAGWSPRCGHATLAFNNKLWVVGGQGSGTYLHDVWSSPDGINWTQVTPSAPFPQYQGMSFTVFNGRMWILGGDQSTSPYLRNDVWSSSDGASWTQATSNAAWFPRDGHRSLSFDNKIWVIGGAGGPNFTSDVWSSPDGINWTQVTPSAPWAKRFFHSAIVFNNKMWLMAGLSFPPGSRSNDVWSSPDGINWTQSLTPTWLPRQWQEVVVTPQSFGLPDLIITSVVLDPTTLHKNLTYPYVTFDFTIKNAGLIPLTIPITTKFSLYGVGGVYGGQLVGQFLPGNSITLLPNQKYTFNKVNTSATPNLRANLGPISLRLVADDSSIISERDENNNTFSFGITIIP